MENLTFEEKDAEIEIRMHRLNLNLRYKLLGWPPNLNPRVLDKFVCDFLFFSFQFPLSDISMHALTKGNFKIYRDP